MLNILEGRLRRSYLIVGIAFCLPIWVLSIGACLVTGTMHQPQWFIFMLMTIYFIGLVISVIEQVRIFRRVCRTLDHDLGNPADNLLRHIRIGAYMLYATSIVIPFTLMTHYFMAALGFLMMPMFFIFTISFICLGSNTQGACEALAGYDENENPSTNSGQAENADENPDDDVDAQIEVAIAQWRKNRGFADSSLSVTTLAHSIGIPQRQLSSYFSQQNNCTFRSFFQTSFKAQTGMTPKEWTNNH